VEDDGEFIWANSEWYKLLGITYAEAALGQFWSAVAAEDRVRVKDASDASYHYRLEFNVSYTNVNVKTGKRNKVEVQAWPLIPLHAKKDTQVIFLGAIKVLDEYEIY